MSAVLTLPCPSCVTVRQALCLSELLVCARMEVTMTALPSCGEGWAPPPEPPAPATLPSSLHLLYKTELVEGGGRGGGFSDVCTPGLGTMKVLEERWTPWVLLTWGFRVRMQCGPTRNPGSQPQVAAPELPEESS